MNRRAIVVLAACATTCLVAAIAVLAVLAASPPRAANTEGGQAPDPVAPPANHAADVPQGNATALTDARDAADDAIGLEDDVVPGGPGSAPGANSEVAPEREFFTRVSIALLQAAAERNRLRSALPVGVTIDDASLAAGDIDAIAAALTDVEVWGSKKLRDYNELPRPLGGGPLIYVEPSMPQDFYAELGRLGVKRDDGSLVFTFEATVQNAFDYIESSVVFLRLESQRAAAPGLSVHFTEVTSARIHEDLTLDLPVIRRRDITLAEFSRSRFSPSGSQLVVCDRDGNGGSVDGFPEATAFERGEFSIGSEWRLAVDPTTFAPRAARSLEPTLPDVPLCHARWGGALIDLTDASTTTLDRDSATDDWTRCSVEMTGPLLSYFESMHTRRSFSIDPRQFVRDTRGFSIERWIFSLSCRNDFR